MFLKNGFNFAGLKNFPYKIVLLGFVLVISNGCFRFLDKTFQKWIGLNKYFNFFDLIAFGLFIYLYLNKDRFKKYFSIHLSFFLLFMLSLRVSVLFSAGEIHHKTFYDLFTFFLAVILSILVLSEYFHKNSKIIIKCFLLTIFTIAFFETILGVLQFVLQKPLGFFCLNEPFFSIQDPLSAKIYIANKSKFLLSLINPNGFEFLRAHGTFCHPNTFAGFLNISCLLTLYQIYRSKNKFIFSLFLVFQIIALFLTFSRAGALAFFFSSFCFFFLMFIKKYDIKKVGLVYLSVIFCLFCLFSKNLKERGYFGHLFQSRGAKELNSQSDLLRSKLKNVAINMIKKKPFFGVGFRNFLIKRQEFSKESVERAYVHNIYLLIAAENGLISFFLFILLLMSIFINLFRLSLNPLTIAIFCIVVSFLIIGFFDHYPISSNFGRFVLFLNLGFLNYNIYINQQGAYSQRVFLYQ